MGKQFQFKRWGLRVAVGELEEFRSRVHVLGFSGSGSRVQGCGFRAQGSGDRCGGYE